jgi:hypothetical protein
LEKGDSRVGQANRKKAKAPKGQEALGYPVLTLPGVVSNRFWNELAEEARAYINLLDRLTRTATDASEREELEDRMISSLSHLAMHSSVLYESVDEAIENSDDDQFQELVLIVKTFDSEALERQEEGEADEAELEEGGYLDYLDKAFEATDEIAIFLRNYDESVRYMSGKVAEHATRLAKNNRIRGQKNPAAKLRAIANDAARNINAHADETDTTLPEFKRSTRVMSRNFMKYLEWLVQNDAAGQGVQDAARDLRGLRESIREARLPTETFLESVLRLKAQNVPMELNRACQRLSKQLEEALGAFRHLEEFSTKALALLERESQ